MSAEETEQIAARWLAREDRGLAADEQKAMDAWLAGSAHHRASYLQLKAIWRLADRLADLLNSLPGRQGDGDG